MATFEYYFKNILIEAYHRGNYVDFSLVDLFVFILGLFILTGIITLLIFLCFKIDNPKLLKTWFMRIYLMSTILLSLYWYISNTKDQIFKRNIIKTLKKNTKSYNTTIYRIDRTLHQTQRSSRPFKQETKYYQDNEYTYYIRLGSAPNAQFIFNRDLASLYSYINTLRDGDSVKVEEMTYEGKVYLLSLTPI